VAAAHHEHEVPFAELYGTNGLALAGVCVQDAGALLHRDHLRGAHEMALEVDVDMALHLTTRRINDEPDLLLVIGSRYTLIGDSSQFDVSLLIKTNGTFPILPGARWRRRIVLASEPFLITGALAIPSCHQMGKVGVVDVSAM
jgi:hypothetical protein